MGRVNFSVLVHKCSTRVSKVIGSTTVTVFYRIQGPAFAECSDSEQPRRSCRRGNSAKGMVVMATCRLLSSKPMVAVGSQVVVIVS